MKAEEFAAVRDAEATGDHDLVRRALVMLAFYYKQTGRTVELETLCRRLAIAGTPCWRWPLTTARAPAHHPRKEARHA